MSDSLSIAAVTSTIRSLLARGVSDVMANNSGVTTRPPDRARTGASSSEQLNLYLYQTLPNAALRNQDLPLGGKSGQTGHAPLALDLFYLLTAFGRDDEDLTGNGHQLLGSAMLTLHDHAVLSREEIASAEPNSNLHEQVERIRITPQALTLDEMSRLWNTFQTQHRLSTAYKVSVVLIDSQRESRTPLPVLTRGKDDSGISSQPNLLPTVPTLEKAKIVSLGADPSLEKAIPKQVAELGDSVSIFGHRLTGIEEVQLSNSLLNELPDTEQIVGEMKTVDVSESAEGELKFELSDKPQEWVAGFYLVSATKVDDDKTHTTNQLVLPLAPKVEGVSAEAAGNNRFDVTVKVKPNLIATQKVEVLIGDRQFKIIPEQISGGEINFEIENTSAGEYLVRVRVDGVDSDPVDRSGKTSDADLNKNLKFRKEMKLVLEGA